MEQLSSKKNEGECTTKSTYPLFIHLFRDSIFIDTIIQQFIDLEIESKFLCYSETGTVSSVRMEENIEIFNNLRTLGKTIMSMPKKTVFVLHSRCFSYIFINKYLKGFRIIWSTWGYDIYKDNRDLLSLNLLSIPMYKEKTSNYERWSRTTREKIKDIIRYVVYFFPSKKFYASIRYISCVLPNEFERLKQINPSLVYIPLRYLGREKVDNQLDDNSITNQNNILLNNSGARTGNHIDILYHIKDFIDESTIIYIPFSYGGSKEYYSFLKKEIKKMNLEKNIVFLTEFLEYEEYARILKQCSIAIFGHIRQQAMGNVNLMLRLGAKVFFYEDSIAYEYFSKIGIKVFDLMGDFNEETVNASVFFDGDTNRKIKEISNYETYLINLRKSLDLF